MWRGFAIKKGISAEARKFYDDLFSKLMKDSEWIEYVSKRGVDPVYYKHDKFYKIVLEDKADVTRWLKNSGILK
jgi:tripartite-type tricarboxylate transporter receptor subunit TctC